LENKTLIRLIGNLKDFASTNEIIRCFLSAYTEGFPKRKEIIDELQNRYGKKLEDKIKAQLKSFLEELKYSVSSKDVDVKLPKPLFGRNTKTDLKISLKEKTVYIEVKLNYPPKKEKGSATKTWGYEEFISLKEKFNLYSSKEVNLILLIIDAHVKRYLEEDEKSLLKRADKMNVNVLRVFLNESNPNKIKIEIEYF